MNVYVVVIVLVVGMAAAIWLVRKYMMDWMHGGGFENPPFTLAELRELHESGAMTDEEFERAKERMLRAVHRSTPDTGPTPGPNRTNH